MGEEVVKIYSNGPRDKALITKLRIFKLSFIDSLKPNLILRS